MKINKLDFIQRAQEILERHPLFEPGMKIISLPIEGLTDEDSIQNFTYEPKTQKMKSIVADILRELGVNKN